MNVVEFLVGQYVIVRMGRTFISVLVGLWVEKYKSTINPSYVTAKTKGKAFSVSALSCVETLSI